MPTWTASPPTSRTSSISSSSATRSTVSPPGTCWAASSAGSLSPQVNFSPEPVLNADGSVRHPGLDNHAMGTIFEDLVRRFNEDNNEEAGEHWTPRDAVELMAQLVFQPIRDRIESGTYLLYDGAIGTGGMLTIAEQTLQGIAAENDKQVSTHLFGQEINNETYAICKADMLLKGERNVDENIIGGPQHSTLSNDAFRSRTFDFMLSNPPYGKSWKGDLGRMGGKSGLKDPRFLISHGGNAEYSLVTRTSDGQMLFMANMASKMNHESPVGSRVAEVHNGSSLFTGDAGQGESNIRRWIIENDWLEAIVALPLNMFYNTGIATYVWVLTNRKPKHRKGKIQLIDATKWFTPLRKNLGQKNCELSPENIRQIVDTYMDFEETEQSKIFPNEGVRVLEGHRGTAAEAGRHRPRASLQSRGDQEAEGGEREGRERLPCNPAGAVGQRRGQPLGGQGRCDHEGENRWSWSTSPTPICGTPSRSRCYTKGGSRRSSRRRSSPTRRMLGTTLPPCGSDTRSTSTGTSTSPSRCGPWRRSVPTFWHWNRRWMGCWRGFSIRFKYEISQPIQKNSLAVAGH